MKTIKKFYRTVLGVVAVGLLASCSSDHGVPVVEDEDKDKPSDNRLPEREDPIVISHVASDEKPAYVGLKHAVTAGSKSHLTRVFTYSPSFGQHINTLPAYTVGDTREDMAKKAEKDLAKKNAGMVSLGGYGGYVVVGFDHTIENKANVRDFRVLGNAFVANANLGVGGSVESGIIMVSYDANGDGEPNDPWFEIKGSAHDNAETIKNYAFTFYQPEEDAMLPEAKSRTAVDGESGATPSADEKGQIKWSDNQGDGGFKKKNGYHSQTYFPQWINTEKITYIGTLLPVNVFNRPNGEYDQLWLGQYFEYGYADNHVNDANGSAIDIAWAVNSNGEHVNLPGIDFVKVYTGVNIDAGWLGEISTDFAGVRDLHLDGVVIATDAVNTEVPKVKE